MARTKKVKRKTKKKVAKAKTKKRPRKKKKKKVVKLKVQKLQAIDAVDIPCELTDACMDIDDEFPLHYSNGIVRVEDDGNPFSEWLKTSTNFKFTKKGYFKDSPNWDFLACW